MRLVVTELIDFEDGYEELEIVINNTTKFKVGNYDSPEDNTLSRNFSDCYDIPELLRKAYEAGKNGEEFVVEYEENGEE
jgi:hypothetical protein